MTTELSVNDQENERASREDAEARAKIGRRVVYFALCVIGILGLAAIAVAIYAPTGEDAAKSKQRFDLVKDILTALLPVLGTWVGTVLAFYFSKDNFVAAAKQTSDLVRQLTPDQKLQEIPVVEVMISMTEPGTIKLNLDKPEDKINIKADILDALLSKSGRNRLPLIDNDGKAKYVIHRSIIDKFISEQALSGAIKPIDITLKDLLGGDQYKQMFTAFGTVSKNAKLNAVKTLMDGNKDCSDVFVTEDGTKNSKALGWITNVILAEKSKV
jgi:predicted transcriptional regulator